MAYTNHEALIIGKTPTAEHDKILNLLLEDGRRVEAKIRKARDTSAKWTSITEPVSLVELELYEKANRFTITSINLLEYFDGIYSDFIHCVASDYIFELIQGCTPYGCAEIGLFEITLESYRFLAKKELEPLSVLASYLLDFSNILGYGTNFYTCKTCGVRVESNCGFDVKTGQVVCSGCKLAQHLNIPDYALKAIQALGTSYTNRLDLNPKLAFGVITLLERVIKDRFDFVPKSSYHLTSKTLNK